MRVLITGASGFIGFNLIRYLSKWGFDIVRASRDSPENSSEKTLSYNDLDLHGMKNCEAIVHLAGKAHDLNNDCDKHEYYQANTELTKMIFDTYLASDAKVFIMISSVKAVADQFLGELDETILPNPTTHYGKSKLLAEQYVLSNLASEGKRVYILRPCMIHGPGNKGNLNLLYLAVSKGIPWPLGAFSNQRSFCSIQNICFIIKEFLEREDVSSGIYNVSDDLPLSTNEVIKLIAKSQDKEVTILSLKKLLIRCIASLGDILNLPINSHRLQKLTESYVVNNGKIKKALNKPLPVSSMEGLLLTFKSFSSNA